MSEKIKVKVNPTFHTQLQGNSKWTGGTSERYKEYRRKWSENPKEFVVEDAPIHLDIETSSVCNLRCPMCFCTLDLEKGTEQKIKRGLMDMDRFKKIIDEAVEIGVYSVKINWRGEPLMNPHIPEMIKYAKDKGIIDVMMNTNGVVLTPELSEKIIDAGLDKIFFSVDSHVKDKYEKIRIGAEFEQTIENIKTFARINDEKGHPVYTRVQKVLLNETAEENDEFIDFFKGFIDQVAFEDYIPYGELELGKSVERNKSIKFACTMLWQRLLITWNGEYMICCPSGGKGIPFGHNDEESIKEFWLGEKMQNIRELHKNGEWWKVGICEDCYVPHM